MRVELSTTHDTVWVIDNNYHFWGFSKYRHDGRVINFMTPSSYTDQELSQARCVAEDYFNTVVPPALSS